jgi:hypothetical protein
MERCYLEKSHHKKGLVEWLKVQALSLSPSTAKKKKRIARGLRGEMVQIMYASMKKIRHS